MSKELKYLCFKCKNVQPSFKTAKIVDGEIVLEHGSPVEVDYIKVFKQKITQADGTILEKELPPSRKLACGHFIFTRVIGFIDSSSDNLSEQETLAIRREIDKTLVGKMAKDWEAIVLKQVEDYNLLLKLATKQKQQWKYALLMLEQHKERYAALLANPEEKKNFEVKFSHFTREDYQHGKVVERERNKVEKEADKQKAALEEMKALLMKRGYDPKDLLGGNKSPVA